MTCMRKVLAVAWLNNLILYLFWVIRGATLTTYRAQIFHELINIRFYFFGKSSDNAIAWSKILLWIICAMHRDESTKPTKPFMLSKFFKYFKFYECWFLLSLSLGVRLFGNHSIDGVLVVGYWISSWVAVHETNSSRQLRKNVDKICMQKSAPQCEISRILKIDLVVKQARNWFSELKDE